MGPIITRRVFMSRNDTSYIKLYELLPTFLCSCLYLIIAFGRSFGRCSFSSLCLLWTPIGEHFWVHVDVAILSSSALLCEQFFEAALMHNPNGFFNYRARFSTTIWETNRKYLKPNRNHETTPGQPKKHKTYIKIPPGPKLYHLEARGGAGP